MGKVIDVLGTKYSIEYKTAAEDTLLETCDGYSDHTSNRIIVRTWGKDEKRLIDSDDMEVEKRKVLRHEIVHAFLAQSGLTSYTHDEVIVEWIAKQLCKINAAVNEADAPAYNGGSFMFGGQHMAYTGDAARHAVLIANQFDNAMSDIVKAMGAEHGIDESDLLEGIVEISDDPCIVIEEISGDIHITHNHYCKQPDAE